MPKVPKASEVMAIRVATGLGVNEAREFLESKPKLLVTRILEAAKIAGRVTDAVSSKLETTFLEDPLIGDSEVGPVVQRVLEEESEKARQVYPGRGVCHLIWKNTKERLQNQYGIEWYSPAELNPGVCFD